MTKKEAIAKRDAAIENLIDKFRMEEKCNLPRDVIKKLVVKAMVQTNFSYVLADVANSFMIDSESTLRVFDVAFTQSDKYNFRKMLDCIKAAKQWAKKTALPMYQTEEDNLLFSADSDWWYYMIMLIHDRTGESVLKTRQLLDFTLNMPTEMDMFKVTLDDFERKMYDKEKQ